MYKELMKIQVSLKLLCLFKYLFVPIIIEEKKLILILLRKGWGDCWMLLGTRGPVRKH